MVAVATTVLELCLWVFISSSVVLCWSKLCWKSRHSLKAATSLVEDKVITYPLRKRNIKTGTTESIQPLTESLTEPGVRSKPSRRVLIACFVIGYLILVLFETLFVGAVEPYVLYTPTQCSRTASAANPEECLVHLNVSFEHVYFTGHDGTLLHGVFVPSDLPKSSNKPLNMLINLGSDGNVGFRFYPQLYEWLAKHGVNVLAYDYPGYGTSEGTPTEESLNTAADRALYWLLSRTGGTVRDTLVYGYSLGGPIAISLAVKHSVKAVVLQASLDRVGYVSHSMLPFGGWLLPYTLPEQYDALNNIKQVHSCTYFLIATDDEVFPESRELNLYNSAFNIPAECKHYYRLVGYGHLDNPLNDSGFVKSFSSFIDSMK